MEKQRALVVAPSFDEVRAAWKTLDSDQYSKEGLVVTWPSDELSYDLLLVMIWNRSDHDYGKTLDTLFGLIVFMNCKLSANVIEILARHNVNSEVRNS